VLRPAVAGLESPDAAVGHPATDDGRGLPAERAAWNCLVAGRRVRAGLEGQPPIGLSAVMNAPARTAGESGEAKAEEASIWGLHTRTACGDLKAGDVPGAGDARSASATGDDAQIRNMG